MDYKAEAHLLNEERDEAERYAQELEREVGRLKGLLEQADILILDLREDLRKAKMKWPPRADW